MKNLTFEQWATFVFDHPVDETRLEWNWDPDVSRWEGPATVIVQYLTQAFENAAITFQSYSEGQLKQGL